MTGSHVLTVKTPRCKYRIQLNRNITVLTGDSGLGKTALCDAIRKYKDNNGRCEISIMSDCNVVVSGNNWESFIGIHDNVKNSIILIDEGFYPVCSKDFAKVVCNSTNYFLIISRVPIPTIPYSCKSVLTLRTCARHDVFETYSEELYSASLYGNIGQILTEDSSTGRAMWKRVSVVPVRDVLGEPEGKTTLYEKAKKITDAGDSCIIVADGAAFGSEILEVMQLTKDTKRSISLFLPESFEWLLLKSGIVWKRGVDEILAHPEEYIKSEEFCSWERFFTWLAEGITEQTNHPYSKSRLNDWYTTQGNLEKFKSAIPKALRDKICGDV